MKKNNSKKGFTMVELMAVIAILAIISLVAYVSISAIIKNSRLKAYKSIEEAMKRAAANYIVKEDPKFSRNSLLVTNNTLINEKYLDAPKDPKTHEECSQKYSYVKVNKTTGTSDKKIDNTLSGLNKKNSYSACLVCGDYISADCKDTFEISSEYYDVYKDESYKQLNNGDSIKLNSTSNIYFKYGTAGSDLNKIAGLWYNLDGNKCGNFFALSDVGNNIILIKPKNLDEYEDGKCEIIVRSDEDGILKSATYPIEKSDEDSSRYSAELVVGGKVTSEVKIINATDLILEAHVYDNENDGEEVPSDLVEIALSEGADTCVELKDGHVLSPLPDVEDCTNMRLKVSYQGTVVRYFPIKSSYVSVKLLESVGSSKVVLYGRYSSGVSSSYYSDNINIYPASATNKNLKCGIIGLNEANIGCSIKNSTITFGADYNGGKKGKPNSSPIVVYAYSEDNPEARVYYKVNVKNVVPTSIRIRASSSNGTKDGYYCKSGGNQRSIILTPSNAFTSSETISETTPGTLEDTICSIRNLFHSSDDQEKCPGPDDSRRRISATVVNNYDKPVTLSTNITVNIRNSTETYNQLNLCQRKESYESCGETKTRCVSGYDQINYCKS